MSLQTARTASSNSRGLPTVVLDSAGRTGCPSEHVSACDVGLLCSGHVMLSGKDTQLAFCHKFSVLQGWQLTQHPGDRLLRVKKIAALAQFQAGWTGMDLVPKACLVLCMKR